MFERNVVIDFARGIVIILVVIGHLVEGSISTFIFAFHMPFFFLISGYLFKKETVNLGFMPFIIKKAKHLLIPLFVYRGIGIVLGAYAKEHTLKEIIRALFWTPGSGWFFSSLFLAITFLWIYIKFDNINDKYIFKFFKFVLTFYLMFLSATIYYEFGYHDFYLTPFRVDTTFIGITFIITGYELSKRVSIVSGGGHSRYLIIIIPVFLLVCGTIKYNGYVNMAAMSLGRHELLYYFNSIMMTIIVIVLSKAFVYRGGMVYKGICVLGKNSMIVYIAHSWIFYIISLIIKWRCGIEIDRYKFPYNLIYFLISMPIIVLIVCKYNNLTTKGNI